MIDTSAEGLPEQSPLDLEGELESDNPKGRLWETCAARGLAPPRLRHAMAGSRHRVEMELTVGEWELSSGVHGGASRKVAEQLASRALLEELDALGQEEPASCPPPSHAERVEQAIGDDVFDVDEDDAERLRRSNPKGQVYEWCQRQKPPVRRPRFAARRVRGATLVRARLETCALETPWFRAPRRKEAEHAAAEALLHLLPASDDAPDLDVSATANPRTLLNELVQSGELAACRVDVTGRSGPDHAPRFTAEGVARFPDGSEVRAAPFAGASKREAVGAAARALLVIVQGDSGSLSMSPIVKDGGALDA
ncbi:MAG TPA: hypothetical protein DEF51_33290 [Myxococcales bacterium]|nr:hypothetical protein [Myxococcales bacterium]